MFVIKNNFIISLVVMLNVEYLLKVGHGELLKRNAELRMDKYRSDDLNYISNANSRNNKTNYNKVNDFIGQPRFKLLKLSWHL